MQVDTLVFQAAPKPLNEHIVHPPSVAVHGDANPGLPQYAGEPREVNWLPCSLLKIAGRPNRAKASSRASTHNSTSIVFDARQDSSP
jgi:hypothetical protein